MNRPQRVVIWIAILVAIAMYLYPPKSLFYGDKQNGDAGFMPLWVTRVEESYNARVDFTRLFVQYTLVAGLATAAILSLRSKS